MDRPRARTVADAWRSEGRCRPTRSPILEPVVEPLPPIQRPPGAGEGRRHPAIRVSGLEGSRRRLQNIFTLTVTILDPIKGAGRRGREEGTVSSQPRVRAHEQAAAVETRRYSGDRGSFKASLTRRHTARVALSVVFRIGSSCSFLSPKIML